MLPGLFEHIVKLIEGYPYEVALIDKWGDDIFAVYHKVPVFRVLQIPRRCHESFTRFCVRLKENNVQNCCLEYAGRTDDGEPNLRKTTFKTVVWNMQAERTTGNQMNNGEVAGLKLKFYGCTDIGRGDPLIRISGKLFLRYLV